jgi:hypothetical protein
MTHEEAIQQYRQGEDVESVLVLLGKESLQVNLRKVALAWPKVPVKRREAKDLSDGPDLWDRLWESVEIDIETLGSISNTRTDCYRYVTMLKGYRLIYPDGTLSTVAQKALRALAKAELGL